MLVVSARMGAGESQTPKRKGLRKHLLVDFFEVEPVGGVEKLLCGVFRRKTYLLFLQCDGWITRKKFDREVLEKSAGLGFSG